MEKNHSFFVIFIGNGLFSDLFKIGINFAKKSPAPRVSNHNISFELNLISIFKYLGFKTVRQNSLVRLFFGHKNRQITKFCWTVLDSRYLNKYTFKSDLKWSIMKINYGDRGYFCFISDHPFTMCLFIRKCPFMTKKYGIFSHCAA